MNLKSILVAFATVLSFQVSACELKDPRVCEIAQVVAQATNGHQVQFVEDGPAVGPRAEYEWVIGGLDRVHLGWTRDYDDVELFYLIAHEIGHSVLKHGRLYVARLAVEGDKNLPDLDLVKKYGKGPFPEDSAASLFNHQQEYEADDFAVRLMKARNLDFAKGMRGVLKNNSETFNHPSRFRRIERAKLLAQSMGTPTATAQN